MLSHKDTTIIDERNKIKIITVLVHVMCMRESELYADVLYVTKCWKKCAQAMIGRIKFIIFTYSPA